MTGRRVAPTPHLGQTVPGVDSVDLPDVVFPRVDGEQAGVGVIELKARQKRLKVTTSTENPVFNVFLLHFSDDGRQKCSN